VIAPKLYKAKAIKKEMINKRDLLAEFQFIEPAEFEFYPGQFVNLNVG
jgi:NAD(P)H-flavin reductase